MADPLMRKMLPNEPLQRRALGDPYAESDRPMLAPGATDADTRGAAGNPNLSPQDQLLLEQLLKLFMSPGGADGAAGSTPFQGIQGMPPVR